MPGTDVIICLDFTVAAPVITPASGVYPEDQQATITCATAGASIHYTTDGTAPTAESALYTEPIPVSRDTVIRAIAVKEGMKDSAEAEVQILRMYQIYVEEDERGGILTAGTAMENQEVSFWG